MGISLTLPWLRERRDRNAGPDDPVVAGQDPRDVLDAFPFAHADLFAPDVTGWPPRLATAISVALRVRFDGFSKMSATPAPARTGSGWELGEVQHGRQVGGVRSSISRKWRIRAPRREDSTQYRDRLKDLVLGDQE